MSQSSCLKFLKRKNKWLSTTQIANGIKVVKGCALHSLSALFKHKEIDRRERKMKTGGTGFEWRIK